MKVSLVERMDQRIGTNPKRVFTDLNGSKGKKDRLGPGGNLNRSQRLSTSAWAMVPRSTYSSSLPTGTPRASRVTCTPRALSA